MTIVSPSTAVSNATMGMSKGQVITASNVNATSLRVIGGPNVDGKTIGEQINKVKITYELVDIIDLSTSAVTADASTYTGEALSPVIKVGNTTLVEGTDYEITELYSNTDGRVTSVTNAGDYSVTIEGEGDYTGEKTVPWTVNKADAAAE